MKKTITVEFETWRELTKIKADLNAGSLNQVIKYLIAEWKNSKTRYQNNVSS